MKLFRRNKFIILILFSFILFSFFLNVNGKTSGEDFNSNNLTLDNSGSKSVDLIDVEDLPELVIDNIDDLNSDLGLTDNISKVKELPDGSVAVRLPKNRIGIRLENGSYKILPIGSAIVKELIGKDISVFSDWTKAVISVNDQDSIIGVPKIENATIDNFVSNSKYNQYINDLDKYKVEIVVNELQKSELKENIVSYKIDWGDGTHDIYNPEKITVAHVYKKSGTYIQTFNITDAFGLSYEFEKEFTVNYEGNVGHLYLVMKEYKTPIFTTTTFGIGLTLIGFILFTESGKYKFLALMTVLMPLYTRLHKEDVLDQFVRGQIYGYIKTNPGVHYNQIRRGIDVKNGTLSYHLRVLEKTELIKSRKEGIRYRAFYPTGMKFPKVERYRLTELQTKILDIIKSRDGINQKDISKILNKKPQVINYNIKVLRQAELIIVKKIGRKTICFFNEAEPTESYGE